METEVVEGAEGEGEEEQDPKEEEEGEEQQTQEDEQPSVLSLPFSTFSDLVDFFEDEEGQGRRRRRMYDREGLTHHSSPKLVQHLSMFVGLVAFLVTIWFSVYIIMTFLARPVSQWVTVSDFSGGGVASVSMGVHWVFGITMMATGFLLFPQAIRTEIPPFFHRWVGRIYVLSGIITGLAGLLYVFWVGTVGGLVMDIPFAIYGVSMILCGGMTWYNSFNKKFKNHRWWAARLFALGLSSGFYRILIVPLLLGAVSSRKHQLIWMDIASWFFFALPLLLIEFFSSFHPRYSPPLSLSFSLLIEG